MAGASVAGFPSFVIPNFLNLEIFFVYNIKMDSLPRSLRIGVIRGGPSTEYKESLLTGEYVLSHLRETHKPFDIFISKDGTWHMQGVPRTPDRVLKHTDVVWNALHGEYGEDGK